MNFDPERAMDHARAIARPRLVGSGEDARVAGEIRSKLEDFGYRVEEEPFAFHASFVPILRLQIALSILTIGLALSIRPAVPGIAAALAGFLLLLLASGGAVHRWVRAHTLIVDDPRAPSAWVRLVRRLGRRYSTANIVACLPEAPGAIERPVLYLMAHYDSKSQYMPLALRISLFAVAIAGSLLFAGTFFLAWLWPVVERGVWVIGGLTVLASLPLLGLSEENGSPGAIDDAAGVGTVLHLAEVLAQDSRIAARLDVRPVITSAEEWGLMGSEAFVRVHAHRLGELSRGPGVGILNFDGVGVDGGVHIVEGGPSRPGGRPMGLGDIVREAGAEVGVRIGRFPAIGALFDHFPLAERGFDAITLIGIGRASAAVHTPSDTPERLSADAFETIGRLACRVIERVANTAGMRAIGTTGRPAV